MSHAFYLPAKDWADTLLLSGEEAVHARASRLRTGETVNILDGQGTVACCRVSSLKRKAVELEIISIEKFSPPQSRAVMAIAVSKASRRGFFLEKAAELGAWEIWLWHAERSQGQPSPEMLDSCRAKLIAGMKQSENPWLPGLRSIKNVSGLVEEAASADWRVLPWEAQTGLPMLDVAQLGRDGVTVYAIGPEGGFTDAEVCTLKDGGFEPASLGNRALRCETAATLCLGLHWWASQLPGQGNES